MNKKYEIFKIYSKCEGKMKKIRTVIIEDHKLLRVGLKSLLEKLDKNNLRSKDNFIAFNFIKFSRQFLFYHILSLMADFIFTILILTMLKTIENVYQGFGQYTLRYPKYLA